MEIPMMEVRLNPAEQLREIVELMMEGRATVRELREASGACDRLRVKVDREIDRRRHESAKGGHTGEERERASKLGDPGTPCVKCGKMLYGVPT